MADYKMDCCGGFPSHGKDCPSQTPEKVAARAAAERERRVLDDKFDRMRFAFLDAGWLTTTRSRRYLLIGLDGDDKPVWASKLVGNVQLGRNRHCEAFLDAGLEPMDEDNPVERLS